ncbi:ABC transporter permease [Prescottella equi]|uniref:ABC transporter permease n=1 Tax=Rhodococcus hoagii TaxID=43767 RepID=UPI0020C613F3|nr:ABC transporter permease [Prescottella equi]
MARPDRRRRRPRAGVAIAGAGPRGRPVFPGALPDDDPSARHRPAGPGPAQPGRVRCSGIARRRGRGDPSRPHGRYGRRTRRRILPRRDGCGLRHHDQHDVGLPSVDPVGRARRRDAAERDDVDPRSGNRRGPTFARIARANAISFSGREFVTASKSLGSSTFRILRREILPNILLPVFSFATVVAASLVVAEGSLSFLGLGIPPPTPSWGGMIAAGRESLYDHPHLVLVPGLFFFLTVLSLNLIGDWARDRVGRESSL